MLPNSTLEPWMEAVVRDTSNELLLACLDQILQDPRRLLETARMSYRHQLGFMKLTLRNDESGGALRLHVWDGGATELEDIHSHCADFISRIVLGGLEERHYELIPGETFACFRYSFDSQAGHALSHADGLADVIQTAVTPLLAGAIYHRRSHELHTVASTLPNTITVSAWSARVAEAVVIKPEGARAEDCGVMAGIPPALARSLLNSICRRLNVST